MCKFQLDLKTSGSFGLLALFARALGGIVSDRVARSKGLRGRRQLLFVLIIGEGLGLMGWAGSDSIAVAIPTMLIFGLFTHMIWGTTYSLVPFIDRDALGGVAGIVGAGSNVGAVVAGFLMKGATSTESGLHILGICVTVSASAALAVRFSPEHTVREATLYDEAVAARACSASTHPAGALPA